MDYVRPLTLVKPLMSLASVRPIVRADPNLFGSPAERVALTAEHAAARSWPIDQPIRPSLIML
jgi:hypothetical protein